jgi:hypothetical protein
MTYVQPLALGNNVLPPTSKRPEPYMHIIGRSSRRGRGREAYITFPGRDHGAGI